MGFVVCCSLTQSCPSLCDPTDCSPTGSTVHGILQGRILEWVAMPFSRGSSETWVSCIAGRFSIIRATREAQLSSVQSLSRARLFATLWTTACHASLSINSQSLPKLTSIELMMPSNHLIFCHLLLLLPSIFPASESFPMSQLFTSGCQSIGASASASVLPMNIQD